MTIESPTSQSELFKEALLSNDFAKIDWSLWDQIGKNGQWLTMTTPDSQVHVDVNLGDSVSQGPSPKFFIMANINRAGEVTSYGEKHKWALNPVSLQDVINNKDVEIETTLNDGEIPQNITGIVLVDDKFEVLKDDKGAEQRYSTDNFMRQFGESPQIDEHGNLNLNNQVYTLMVIATGDKNRDGRDNDGYFIKSTEKGINYPNIIASEKVNVPAASVKIALSIHDIIE